MREQIRGNTEWEDGNCGWNVGRFNPRDRREDKESESRG